MSTKDSNYIVILGGGESGVGAALLAKAKGFNVFLSDAGKLSDKYKTKLTGAGIEFEEGTHTLTKIETAFLIIKSPGIPEKSDIIKFAKKNKIKFISEIEFAGRYTKAKTICITGTNGKTTTTLLTYHFLKKAGYKVALAGNVGFSFAELVIEDAFDYYVLELSSFQLDGMFDFKADIGVITNITPDHLDRYEYKIENYVQSKFRMAQNMNRDSVLIYGEDSELLFDALFDLETDARELPFSIEESEGVAAYGDEKSFYINPSFDITQDTPDDSKVIKLDFSKSVLKGKHNLYNAMAASLAAAAAGVSASILQEGLEDFQNAEHRMEKVRLWNGIQFINDSKATNVDSAYYALESIKEPMVWIAGGVDKGNDYSPLFPVIKDKVKALICLGVDNKKLHSSFKSIIPVIEDADSMEKCIQLCTKYASSGDIVLLSPCCASFDLFKNYEDRGAQFKTAVNKL